MTSVNSKQPPSSIGGGMNARGPARGSQDFQQTGMPVATTNFGSTGAKPDSTSIETGRIRQPIEMAEPQPKAYL